MINRLPNLELLEYQANLYFNNSETCKQKLEQIRNNSNQKGANFIRPYFTFDVFTQTWSNTATAFDIDDDGHATMGGCAMTTAYTSVAHEMITDTYFVFVDNRICYMVENANEKFLNDLKNRQLESLSVAKKEY
jgi:hypothetical protein